MVAISMYRGNLHRVPDVPRRWQMPSRKLSARDFKSLLTRRRKALSRLRSPAANPKNVPLTEAPPNPAKEPSIVTPERMEAKAVEGREGQGKEDGSEGGGCVGGKSECGNGSEEPVGVQPKKEDAGGCRESQIVEKPADGATADAEANKKEDLVTSREKRKREVEEKLQVLNAKKHNLVQVLKQILNAEEELKRRNNMQGMSTRPPLPLHVDVPNDFGSLARHVTPRMGPESNLGGDMEGGEAEDALNHTVNPRNMLRMSSTSPSSESPLRRLPFAQHNMVLHPSRASPRFAPAGHQAQPGNVPTMSVSGSGTYYVASSPSPAASGGTSVFRDSRFPSPWN